MDFMAKVKEEVAHELMRAEWPKNGLFVQIKSIEDTGRIKMALSECKFNESQKSNRTKFEYVRVEDSIFHPKLQSDFESELLFYSNDNKNFVAFTGDERTLMRCILECSLYRQIETVIDGREEFIGLVNERAINYADEHDLIIDEDANIAFFGSLYDAGCRFVGE